MNPLQDIAEGDYIDLPPALPAQEPIPQETTNTSNIQSILNAAGYKSSPEDVEKMVKTMTPKRNDEPEDSMNWQQFFFETGLGMAAAGGKRGATFLGAMGEGAQGANKNANQRRQEKQRRKDAQSLQEAQALKQVMDILAGKENRDFRENQADRSFGLQERGLDMQQANADRNYGLANERLSIARRGENKGQLSQTENGYMMLDPYSGSVSPVEMDGSPVMPTSGGLSPKELTQMAIDLQSNSITPMSSDIAAKSVMDLAQKFSPQKRSGGAMSLEEAVATMKSEGYTDKMIKNAIQQRKLGE